MGIIYSQRFIDELKDILDFIAKDSLANSLNFEQELKSKINTLNFMPYRFRQSTISSDKNVRDMVLCYHLCGGDRVHKSAWNLQSKSVETLKFS